jgi:enoyl-CoA hydratase
MPEVVEEVNGRVLVITLNRPDARNSIDSAITAGLASAFSRLDEDPGLTVGVLTGANGTFCAGMDLKAFAAVGPPKGLNRLLINGSSKPLVAAIEGAALGGGLELALLCDLLVAADNARLGLPEVRVGLFAAGGGLIRLPARVPLGVALELALIGEQLSGEEAFRHGLVSRVSPAGGSLEVALELAGKIAVNAPLAVAASKRVLRASAGQTEAELWDLQAPLGKAVFTSNDAKEGPRAFAQKRPPEWTGT